jgi:hypothetical protein
MTVFLETEEFLLPSGSALFRVTRRQPATMFVRWNHKVYERRSAGKNDANRNVTSRVASRPTIATV